MHDVLFGTNLAAEAGFPGLKSLHGYNGINMIDNGDGITTYIAATDFTEMATEFQFSKGKVTVKKNEELDTWLKLPDFYAKDVIAKIDANAQIFESTFGVQEVIFKNVTDKASIVDQFTACGFETVASTMVEGAKMANMSILSIIPDILYSVWLTLIIIGLNELLSPKYFSRYVGLNSDMVCS